MKHLFPTLLLLALPAMGIQAARPTPVSLTEVEYTPGSADEFAVKVLTLAFNEQYEDLEPYYSRTWIDWSFNREPEKAWRTVRTATDLSQIHLLPAHRSPVHNEVYYVPYYVMTEDGRRRGAELMFMENDGFKLAIQANRTSVGNDYIKLGTSRSYALKQLGEQNAEIAEESDSVLKATLPSGHVFQLTFAPETEELTGLQLLSDQGATEIYLVIFDLEGTPTIKLRPTVQ